MVKLFELDCLREDLPVVVGQDDLLFGCPPLHLSKGFQGNRGSVSPLSAKAQRGFSHIQRQRQIQGFIPRNRCHFTLKRHLN